MQYTRLGETDLEVSRICFGTWQLGGDWGEIDVEEARAAIHRALELGINFFDTAQAYGFGTSEDRLAEALRNEIGSARDSVVLATKGGLRPEGDGIRRDAGREWLRRGLEESLEHLGTDYVDLYQVHWPDADTPAEETAAALRAFVDEGKVRHVGVSNYNARQMHELERHLKIDTLQPPYHIFRRGVEKHVLPYCEAHGIGTLVYGPLAHGLLGGQYDEDTTFDDGDWRSRSSAFTGEVFAHNLEVVERLKEVAYEWDRGPASRGCWPIRPWTWPSWAPAGPTRSKGRRSPVRSSCRTTPSMRSPWSSTRRSPSGERRRKGWSSRAAQRREGPHAISLPDPQLLLELLHPVRDLGQPSTRDPGIQRHVESERLLEEGPGLSLVLFELGTQSVQVEELGHEPATRGLGLAPG